MPRELLRGEAGRLDVVVARLTAAPRADVQRAIAAGQVLVDGVARAKSFRLVGGERIEFERPDVTELAPEGPAVPVRFRDDDLLVIAKPAGLVTHPTENHRTGTLVNRLRGMGIPLAAAGGPLRPGIVHRLDAGTSGLMIVAQTDAAFSALQAMMKRHDVDRRYLALVRGDVEHDAFEVEAPLGRRGARMSVDVAAGREAGSVFEVRERFGSATLVEAAPRTGRTHQIRVHLASIGHPILGDRTYGGSGADAARLALRRPFLHSTHLAFVHPISGEPIELDEPLPRDLALALERLREGASWGAGLGP